MVNEQAGNSWRPLGEEPIDRLTTPPTSHVAANEAGRKKDWVTLLEKAARAMNGGGGDLSTICREARQIAGHVGDLALQSFSLLADDDRIEIIEAATDRFFRTSPAVVAQVDNPERLFHHAIRCEVIELVKRRLEAIRLGAPVKADGRLDRAVLSLLNDARRRASTLQRLQQRVFLLTLTLDSVSPVVSDERTQEKVLTFLIGVALGLRVNSVHQHQVRLRKRLFPSDLEGHNLDPMSAFRYLWAPPFDLACAALVYRAAYQTRASQRLYSAQKQYAERRRAFKEASERARIAWRGLVAALDASPQRPGDVYDSLVRWCMELGIDSRVCAPKKGDRAGEARSRAQSWADMLLDDDMRRPIGAERDAWRRFLDELVPSLEVVARLRAFEACSVEADLERAAVAAAYRGLLDAAHDLHDIVKTITNLLGLVGATRPFPARG